MRSLPLGSIALVLFFILTGCASSEPVVVQYDGSENVTTYETQPIDAGIDVSTGAIGGGRGVNFRVRARCPGEDCTPERVMLSFVLTGGSSPVYMADRSVVITAGGESYRWVQQRRRKIGRAAPVVSKIVAIPVDLKTLEAIAEAERVTGSLGSKEFVWSYELRKPLRIFVSRLTDH